MTPGVVTSVTLTQPYKAVSPLRNGHVIFLSLPRMDPPAAAFDEFDDPLQSLLDTDDSDDEDYDPEVLQYDSDSSEYVPVAELEDETRPPPFHLHHTQVMRERLALSGLSKLHCVHRILAYMAELNFNLPILLDTILWGDDECISDSKIQYERTALMVSEEFPRILDHCYKVPRSSMSASHFVRPKGAQQALESFSVGVVKEIIDRELEATADLFQSSPATLSESGLTSFSFPQVASQLQEVSRAPNLWHLIRSATERHWGKDSSKSHKNRDHVCFTEVLKIMSNWK